MLLKSHRTSRIVQIEDHDTPQLVIAYSIPMRPPLSQRLSGRHQEMASCRPGSGSGSIERIHSTGLSFGLGPCSVVYLSSRDTASG